METGNRQRYHQRRAPRAQEQQQDHGRQDAADPDVLDHQINRAVDVDGFVVDLRQRQVFRFERPVAQALSCA